LVSNSARKLVIFTGFFYGTPQSTDANSGKMPKSVHEPILPNPFQLFIHPPSSVIMLILTVSHNKFSIDLCTPRGGLESHRKVKKKEL
jgi:hypothetical protein